MQVHNHDAIVIGSGAGGAAAAYRLAIAGHRVLLLEKGNALPSDGSTLDVDQVIHMGRFKSREAWIDGRGAAVTPEEYFNVGGKTKWYGAALVRFSPDEFGGDADQGLLPWPIRYSDLEPYYLEAAQVLGLRQFDCEPDLARILRALSRKDRWQAQPLPTGLSSSILEHPDEARHFDGFASVRWLKSEAESSFLRKIDKLPNVSILTGCEVVRLMGHPSDPSRIIGVELADGRSFGSGRVLLAAGALHSPRLLQKYLDSTGLVDRLPAAANVGSFLKLHLLTALLALSPGRKTDVLRKTTLLLSSRFPRSTVQPLGFDGELISTLFPRFVPRPLARLLGERAYGFFLQTEDSSDARNRVVGGDPEKGRAPVLDYDPGRSSSALAEHKALVRSLQLDLLRGGHLGFSQRIGLAGTAHACGTLVTGKDPNRSVVDAGGQVHGMTGLYVVDGSILPRSSRVNPSLTIYAWALRVADRLSTQLRIAA